MDAFHCLEVQRLPLAEYEFAAVGLHHVEVIIQTNAEVRVEVVEFTGLVFAGISSAVEGDFHRGVCRGAVTLNVTYPLEIRACRVACVGMLAV